jgi:hypothetical protein
MLARTQLNTQESNRLADATTFQLGYLHIINYNLNYSYDEDFVFAYRIINRVNNQIYTFNHSGYLNVSVEQVTTIFSKLKKITFY